MLQNPYFQHPINAASIEWRQFVADFAAQENWCIILGEDRDPVPVCCDVENDQQVYYRPDTDEYSSVKQEFHCFDMLLDDMPQEWEGRPIEAIKQDRIKREASAHEQLNALGYHSPETCFATSEFRWTPGEDTLEYTLLKTSKKVKNSFTLRELKTEKSLDPEMRMAMAEQGARQAVVVGALLDDCDRSPANVLYAEGAYYHIDFEFAGQSSEENVTYSNIRDYLWDDIAIDFGLLLEDFCDAGAAITKNEKITPELKEIYHNRISNAVEIVKEYQASKNPKFLKNASLQ